MFRDAYLPYFSAMRTHVIEVASANMVEVKIVFFQNIDDMIKRPVENSAWHVKSWLLRNISLHKEKEWTSENEDSSTFSHTLHPAFDSMKKLANL